MTWPKFSSYGVKNKLLYQGFFFLEICIQPWKNTKMDRTDVHIAHISYQWECLLPGGDQQITPSFLPLGSKWIRIVRLLNGLRWPQLYQEFFATELFRFSMLHCKKKCVDWTTLHGAICYFDLRLSDEETLLESWNLFKDLNVCLAWLGLRCDYSLRYQLDWLKSKKLDEEARQVSPIVMRQIPLSLRLLYSTWQSQIRKLSPSSILRLV